MTRLNFFRLVVLFALALVLGSAVARSHLPGIDFNDLPPEARQTYQRIQQGGPFISRKDGSVFGNFERQLPQRPRGYYREYTVPTPGLNHRGARRIVTGQSREYYYTANHYRSFSRIRELP